MIVEMGTHWGRMGLLVKVCTNVYFPYIGIYDKYYTFLFIYVYN